MSIHRLFQEDCYLEDHEAAEKMRRKRREAVEERLRQVRQVVEGTEADEPEINNEVKDESLQWMLVKHRETVAKKKKNRMTFCQEDA